MADWLTRRGKYILEICKRCKRRQSVCEYKETVDFKKKNPCKNKREINDNETVDDTVYNMIKEVNENKGNRYGDITN